MPGTGRARIGCSGWVYPHWQGTVYPDDLPEREWLAYYATMFDTVELNTTFYRLPTLAAVDGWREAVPRGFRFALKLGAFGSHRKKLRDPAGWLPNHVERAERLGWAGGPTLVQLPPRWKRNVERLDEFLDAAPKRLHWAVELREPSWLHDDVLAVLAAHGAALCVHDLLADHPFELTSDWTYVRFHGPNALDARYAGRYSGRRLRRWADRLERVLGEGNDAWCYFNNDQHGYAVDDAKWLAQALRDRLG